MFKSNQFVQQSIFQQADLTANSSGVDYTSKVTAGNGGTVSTVGTGGNIYQASTAARNASGTVTAGTEALVFAPNSCAKLNLLSPTIESEYSVSRQGTLFVAKFSAGLDWLRPDHVVEMLRHGRLAHARDHARLIHFAPRHSTHEVIERLYEWPSVVRVAAARQVA